MTLEGTWTEAIGPNATLGDAHWLLVRKEREKPGRHRSSDEIWAEIVKTLSEHGVTRSKLSPTQKSKT